MTTATLRFYEQLNQFLAQERVGTSSNVSARVATANHMIEARGVPHTEVDWCRRMASRWALSERWAMATASPSIRSSKPSTSRRCFVADAHLGGLAHAKAHRTDARARAPQVAHHQPWLLPAIPAHRAAAARGLRTPRPRTLGTALYALPELRCQGTPGREGSGRVAARAAGGRALSTR